MTDKEIGGLLRDIVDVTGEWDSQQATAPDATPTKAALDEQIAQVKDWLDALEAAINETDAMLDAQREADGPNTDEERRLSARKGKLEENQRNLEERLNSLEAILGELYS